MCQAEIFEKDGIHLEKASPLGDKRYTLNRRFWMFCWWTKSFTPLYGISNPAIIWHKSNAEKGKERRTSEKKILKKMIKDTIFSLLDL